MPLQNIFLLLLTMLVCRQNFGQDQQALVNAELKAVSQKYRGSSLLSFEAVYRYALEADPGNYLDSIRGEFRMHGERFWYQMDQTQSVYDGQYLLTIYPEDQVIYLSKPQPDSRPLHPLMSIDSLLANKDIRYSYSATGREKILTLDFTDDPQFRQIRYEIDSRTGLIRKLTQVVNAALMYTPEVAGQLSDAQQFGIVETCFGNYRNGAFDAGVINTGNYVQKQGQRYIANAPYQSYKIFLGTSNL